MGAIEYSPAVREIAMKVRDPICVMTVDDSIMISYSALACRHTTQSNYKRVTTNCMEGFTVAGVPLRSDIVPLGI